MGNLIVAFGVLVWFLFSGISFISLTSLSDSFGARIRQAISLKLNIRTNRAWGISMMKFGGILWEVTGLIINVLGEYFPRGIGGDILLGIMFLGPMWIIAILAENESTKDL